MRFYNSVKLGVDTHVFRVSNRLGLCNTSNVEDTEKEIHVKETQVLTDKFNNVIFVNYDTNIFGIKLN